MTSYPTRETVEMFCEVLQKDGMEDIMEKLLRENTKDLRMIPLLSFFKQSLTQMMEDQLLEEIDGYSSGFLCCLDMFRRQINSEEITLDDVNIQLNNIAAWSNYLEEENILLKNENLRLRDELSELTRRYKELQEMPPPQSNGDITNSSRVGG